MAHESDIKNSVLEKIRKGDVSMRPRIYFAAKAAAIAGLVIAAALLCVFVISFTLFSIRESGEQFLLGFGTRGLATFAHLFPWAAFALVIALLFAVEMLLRSFKFGYRRPVLYALFGVIAAAFVLGWLVNYTPLHPALLDRADRGELPIIGDLYQAVHASRRDQGVVRGVVTSVESGRFVISHDDNDRDTDDGSWTIIAPSGFDTGVLRAGERVFVAGESVASGTLHAYGIEEYVQ